MAIIKLKDKLSLIQPRVVPSLDAQQLLASLGSSDIFTRRQAVRELVNLEDASAVLTEHLRRELEPSVQSAILIALTELGDEKALAGLIECLASEDVQLRNAAIAALKQLPMQVATVIEQLLQNPDADIRIFAVNVLESLRHPLVVNWLIQVIENDSHLNVCATAVDLLGEVGEDKAVPALKRLQQRFAQEPYIQFAVSLALKRIGSFD